MDWQWIVMALKCVPLAWFVATEVTAVAPRPTTASPSWYDETINAFSEVVNGWNNANKLHTAAAAEKDWPPIEQVFGDARAKMAEAMTNLLPEDNMFQTNIQGHWEAFRQSMPGLPFFNLDFESIRANANDWNWDRFAEEMLPVAENKEHKEMKFEDSRIPPECSMTVPDMIKHAGYGCEVHTAETNDGYLLELHRIPFGKHGAKFRDNFKRPVVFFQHGLLADSSCWIANGPDRSLPFILAEAGCDIWLGNVRGSTYSRKHKRLNPDVDEKYWRFSWQNMAQSDLPAMINKALQVSGQTSLYYVGHSQGTLIAFARLAEDPLFNDKIAMMFAFGPVSTLAHITSPLGSLVSLGRAAHFGSSLFGGTEILPKKAISQWISAILHERHKSVINDTLVYHGNNLMMFVCGIHPDNYFEDRLPVYFSHTPAGTSLHNIIHMSQLVESGKMQKWDYKSEVENKKVYGQVSPPEYNVSLIRAPVVLFVGSEDQLADPKDNELLSKKLKSLVYYRMLEGWDHLDFLWGRKAVKTIYKEVVEAIIQKHQSGSAKIKKPNNDELKCLSPASAIQ